MHRGGCGGVSPDAGGKSGGRGYRRDYHQRSFMDRTNGSGMENGQKSGWNSSYTNGSSAVRSNGDQPQQSGACNGAITSAPTSNGHGYNGSAGPQAALAEIEKQVVSMKQDFTSSLHKVGEKENEKFDLIFSILTELQTRQAQLEDSVRALKTQFGGCGSTTGQNGMIAQSPQGGGCQFSMASNGQNFSAQSMGGSTQQMNGGNTMSNGQQMNGGMAMQQQISGADGGVMQGVMSPDGSQIFPMAQMVVLNSPTGGMQYAMPQVMTPNGSMQAIPPQMAMQFMGQGGDMNGGFMVSGSQDGGCMAMPMRPSGNGQGEWNASDDKQGSGGNEAGNASSGGPESVDGGGSQGGKS
eukprot:TRINITY_DN621_c0_g1_i1.p1 TRINITY_DN621_c0_g1~~TRINITY_DN621_c0_g1_i1.p1  ORF type:complete len:353 (-),score=80.97 TRINITY_DN621_c0_g1_i1:164-1222(-)